MTRAIPFVIDAVEDRQLHVLGQLGELRHHLRERRAVRHLRKDVTAAVGQLHLRAVHCLPRASLCAPPSHPSRTRRIPT